MKVSAILLASLAALCGCDGTGETKQRCYIPFKGKALIASDARDGWLLPGEVCATVARALNEASDDVRSSLFGSAVASRQLDCVCEDSPRRF